MRIMYRHLHGKVRAPLIRFLEGLRALRFENDAVVRFESGRGLLLEHVVERAADDRGLTQA